MLTCASVLYCVPVNDYRGALSVSDRRANGGVLYFIKASKSRAHVCTERSHKPSTLCRVAPEWCTAVAHRMASQSAARRGFATAR